MVFDWIGRVADWLSLISAIFAGFAWYNARKMRHETNLELERLNQKVKLRLKSATYFIDLPGEMRREELTRSEVLGWIGMLPMTVEKERERYRLAFTNSAEFFDRMNAIQAGSGDMVFEIPCTEDEIDQFAAEKSPVTL